jgi:hypothetical protein
MLREEYGEMIIKEDSILYHTSDELFEYRNNSAKPMLFCTFHPSDYSGDDNTYVHIIRIKKDISLLFMIDCIGKTHIFSSLNKLINHPKKNLAKTENKVLTEITKDLKNENYDGWFSSIENKSHVEVALINNKNIYEIIETKKLKRNWSNGYYNNNNNNNSIIKKNWGKIYKISCIETPVILNINKKYKKMINEYKEYEIKSKFPLEYIFQIILDNAIIYYN